MGYGRARVRDGSGNGRQFAGFYTPLVPKGGNHPSAVAGAARHCSGQPDGAPFNGYRLLVIGY